MAKERVMLRCPVCAKISPPSAFAAGARGDDTHGLLAKVVAFVGGGREGRPKVQATDELGRPKFDALGQPVMKLARDAEGKPGTGRGFSWSERALTLEERDLMVRVVRAVGQRLMAELIVDALTSADGDYFYQLAERFKEQAVADAEAVVQLVDEIVEARQ